LRVLYVQSAILSVLFVAMSFISDFVLIGICSICNFQLLYLHLRTFVAHIQ